MYSPSTSLVSDKQIISQRISDASINNCARNPSLQIRAFLHTIQKSHILPSLYNLAGDVLILAQPSLYQLPSLLRPNGLHRICPFCMLETVLPLGILHNISSSSLSTLTDKTDFFISHQPSGLGWFRGSFIKITPLPTLPPGLRSRPFGSVAGEHRFHQKHYKSQSESIQKYAADKHRPSFFFFLLPLGVL